MRKDKETEIMYGVEDDSNFSIGNIIYSVYTTSPSPSADHFVYFSYKITFSLRVTAKTSHWNSVE